MPRKVTNIVVAGIGGQGVLKATDILSDAIFRAGYDIKKSEVHGMSQRGGSVCSDVRFGDEVFSPMVPPGEADVLVVLTADQLDPHRHLLKPGGVVIRPEDVDEGALANRKSLNVALLGILSTHLPLPEHLWAEALSANLAPKHLAANREAFALGRRVGRDRPGGPNAPTRMTAS